MVKYFTVIAGFAGLVGTSHALLSGRGLFVAVTLSFLLAVGTLVAWRQSEKAASLKAVVTPLLTALVEQVGAEVVPFVVAAAERPGLRDVVAAVLAETLLAKSDPTERRWIYVALGRVGGRGAKSAIRRGLSDEDEFARRGAEEAWEVVRHRR